MQSGPAHIRWLDIAFGLVMRNGFGGGSRPRLPLRGAMLSLLRLSFFRQNRVENSRFPAPDGGRRYAESSDVLHCPSRISDWRRSIRAMSSPDGPQRTPHERRLIAKGGRRAAETKANPLSVMARLSPRHSFSAFRSSGAPWRSPGHAPSSRPYRRASSGGRPFLPSACFSRLCVTCLWDE